jgi:hypothetical protein
MCGLVTITRLSLNQTLSHIGGQPWKVNLNGVEHTLKTGSQRLQLFKKTQVCACCGIQGRFFRIEHHKGDVAPVINLYGAGGVDNGYVVLMTMDHIIPRAKRGPTTADNVQLLCADCNQLKADELISIKDLQKKARIVAKRKFRQLRADGKKLVWKNPLEYAVLKAILKEGELKGGLSDTSSRLLIEV